MKLFSKIISLVLALSLMLSFAAVAEEKTIVVGTNPEFAPFEFVGDSGEIVGIDIDIIKAVFEKLGYTVKVEGIDWNGLIPALVSGKVGALIAGMTITEERKQSVLFSDPYFLATQSIIVKEDSEVAGEADLHGKRVGVIMGYTGDLFVTDTYTDAEITRYVKSMDAVQDLKNGKLDAIVLDEAPAMVYEKQGIGLKVLDDKLSNEEYAIALPLGSEELASQVNEALAALKADGTIDKIVNEYYNAAG